MPTPRTHPAWIERIKQLRADDPKLTAHRIAQALHTEALKPGSDLPDASLVPSERTIGRVSLPEDAHERALYERVYWPESFEHGALPWEAAEAVLELIAFQEPKRPTVREARWFWRITQAAPGTRLAQRAGMAFNQSEAEVRGEASRAVETALLNQKKDQRKKEGRHE